jgi:hypothetical protein
MMTETCVVIKQDKFGWGIVNLKTQIEPMISFYDILKLFSNAYLLLSRSPTTKHMKSHTRDTKPS